MVETFSVTDSYSLSHPVSSNLFVDEIVGFSKKPCCLNTSMSALWTLFWKNRILFFLPLFLSRALEWSRNDFKNMKNSIKLQTPLDLLIFSCGFSLAQYWSIISIKLVLLQMIIYIYVVDSNSKSGISVIVFPWFCRPCAATACNTA